MPDSDWDSDSGLDCEPNGYIALCKSSHTAQSQIQIHILAAQIQEWDWNMSPHPSPSPAM